MERQIFDFFLLNCAMSSTDDVFFFILEDFSSQESVSLVNNIISLKTPHQHQHSHQLGTGKVLKKVENQNKSGIRQLHLCERRAGQFSKLLIYSSSSTMFNFCFGEHSTRQHRKHDCWLCICNYVPYISSVL